MAASRAWIFVPTPQHIDNFLPPDAYRGLFSAPPPEAPGAEDELVCNIRQGDILDAHHPDYVLIPVDFYAELIESTGLRPVFCGQLEMTPYLETIKERFPAARFVPSRGAVGDFAFVRASRHIVPSVSSFGWLAAWLSAAEQIFMPVLGVLHPLQVAIGQSTAARRSAFRFFPVSVPFCGAGRRGDGGARNPARLMAQNATGAARHDAGRPNRPTAPCAARYVR